METFEKESTVDSFIGHGTQGSIRYSRVSPIRSTRRSPSVVAIISPMMIWLIKEKTMKFKTIAAAALAVATMLGMGACGSSAGAKDDKT